MCCLYFLKVTEETGKVLTELGFNCIRRGYVSVKGKGQLMTYIVQRPSTSVQKAAHLSAVYSWPRAWRRIHSWWRESTAFYVKCGGKKIPLSLCNRFYVYPISRGYIQSLINFRGGHVQEMENLEEQYRTFLQQEREVAFGLSHFCGCMLKGSRTIITLGVLAIVWTFISSLQYFLLYSSLFMGVSWAQEQTLGGSI